MTVADTRDVVYRVIVLANGGQDARDLVTENGQGDYWQEPDTGAWVEAQFHPPPHGVYRRYLSQGGANARAAHLTRNGCVVKVEKSNPIVWGDGRG